MKSQESYLAALKIHASQFLRRSAFTAQAWSTGFFS
jgi:hypothetical protein